MKYAGHEVNRRRLQKFLDQGGRSRSFLFCGPKHSGKGTLARAFGLAWVGGKRDVEFSNAHNIDVLTIFPRVEKKKGIETVLGIKIEEVRNAIRFASLSSVSGRRAVIVDGVEVMNESAQNALLKTLEEPPTGVLIILVAHALDTVQPTVVSRCERVEFGPVSQETMKDFPMMTQEAWELALGLPGLAVRLAQDAQWREEREKMRTTWKTLAGSGVGSRLRAGEMLAKNGEKAIEVLQLWAFLFREQAVLGTGDVRTAMRNAEKMLECVRLLKTTNTNARLMIENTLLGMENEKSL